MMEGVIFCCPPAWRKLLPPGVLGAERAEALAEQYWPLLVLTRRGMSSAGTSRNQAATTNRNASG